MLVAGEVVETTADAGAATVNKDAVIKTASNLMGFGVTR
jgi:hypothetical protein